MLAEEIKTAVNNEAEIEIKNLMDKFSILFL